MSTISAVNIGLQGIHKGIQGVRTSAHAIATANIQPPKTSTPDSIRDIAQPMVEMKLYTHQVQASAKVVQASATLIGSLIDIKA